MSYVNQKPETCLAQSAPLCCSTTMPVSDLARAHPAPSDLNWKSPTPRPKMELHHWRTCGTPRNHGFSS
jgi:hypothetical protein